MDRLDRRSFLSLSAAIPPVLANIDRNRTLHLF
jgi:hypothetical protein